MKTGKLIVLTGPSGVGKGTLIRLLLARHPEIYLSISATTRQPRFGEVDGRDYYFLTRSQFEEMIEGDRLLEWAEYAGNYYGTPKQAVRDKIEAGKLVLLEIEVVGAQAIQHSFPDALRLFILPPSLAELERRLRDRARDTEEAIARRLAQAQRELEASSEFDLRIVNQDLEQALAEVETAIFSPDLPN